MKHLLSALALALVITGCQEPSTESQESVREAQGSRSPMENKARLDYQQQQNPSRGVFR